MKIARLPDLECKLEEVAGLLRRSRLEKYKLPNFLDEPDLRMLPAFLDKLNLEILPDFLDKSDLRMLSDFLDEPDLRLLPVFLNKLDLKILPDFLDKLDLKCKVAVSLIPLDPNVITIKKNSSKLSKTCIIND
ncbi:hypothetical protein RclHR1_03550001 [Rhizophagus clarus]|uniref:Uncharacterized protein n=1 Tax=Rhizophagus clarus TaxID=94130 RepID=A0A2Z6RSN1_9GLOM|nr:hypothetical protein RclHR1_03550001 [Rhizophagus clarus]